MLSFNLILFFRKGLKEGFVASWGMIDLFPSIKKILSKKLFYLYGITSLEPVSPQLS